MIHSYFYLYIYIERYTDIYLWSPLAPVKDHTLQAVSPDWEEREPHLFFKPQAVAAFSVFGSLGENTVTVPVVPADIKDLCITGLFLPLLWGCSGYFYGYFGSGFLYLTPYMASVPSRSTRSSDTDRWHAAQVVSPEKDGSPVNVCPLVSDVCLLSWESNLRLEPTWFIMLWLQIVQERGSCFLNKDLLSKIYDMWCCIPYLTLLYPPRLLPKNSDAKNWNHGSNSVFCPSTAIQSGEDT